MSSSVPPPPPPPTGAGPPPGAPPFPPTGSPPPPPPPPPPNPTDTSTANYFFGFVITFVVLLLLFVGCGIGSWRRLRTAGAWDERLQDVDGTALGGRKRGRRRLVHPVFWEIQTCPKAPTYLSSGKKATWSNVQPISAAFIWSPSGSKQGTGARKQTPVRQDDSSAQGVGAMLRSYVMPRPPRGSHPTRTPPPVERPPPEAIQVAVMITMPSSLSSTQGSKHARPSAVGEYQIGVMWIPCSSGAT